MGLVAKRMRFQFRKVVFRNCFTLFRHILSKNPPRIRSWSHPRREQEPQRHRNWEVIGFGRYSLPEPLLLPSPPPLQASTAALQMSFHPIISGLVVLRNDWSTAASSGDVRRTPARTRQCRIAVRVTSPLKALQSSNTG